MQSYLDTAKRSAQMSSVVRLECIKENMAGRRHAIGLKVGGRNYR